MDELLLIIDNNQQALKSAMHIVRINGSISGFCNNQLPFESYLTEPEKFTVVKWLTNINRYDYPNWVNYWENVETHYRNKLLEGA